jgi:hypothetical protein
MQEHEYAILGGINRANIGRLLTLAAAAISGLLVFTLLTLVDVAKRFNISANLPPTVLSLVGAASVFSALYWVFNRYLWKCTPFCIALKVPDVSGDWLCAGETIDANDGSVERTWSAEVTILQSWDKIRVRLRTKESGSNSISAALMWDDADGYVLLYHYRNDPLVGQPELKAHRGFAELTFTKDLQSANGQYFNGFGRPTSGRMHLRRK